MKKTKNIDHLYEKLVNDYTYHADGFLILNKTKPRVGAGIAKGTIRNGYVFVGIFGEQHRYHRLIYLYFNKKCPDRLDHINRNRSDNRIENLRPATQSQNMANASRMKTSKNKYRGVCWCKTRKKFMAKITVKMKTINLGYFHSEIEAARRYNEKASELFGEFASLNIIN